MKKNKIIYVFDAYCSWCYGMDPVMERIAHKYSDTMDFEVLSGGMVPEDTTVTDIARKFQNPRESFNRVTAMTGESISDSFIEMMEFPDNSDYIFNSTYPARAMSTLKHFAPHREIKQARDLQQLVYKDVKDLTKTESYKSVAENYGIDWEAFVHRFESDESLEKAKYEFHLARQLKVNSYPAVLMQTGDQYFYLIARGYTEFDTLDHRIQDILLTKSKENGTSLSHN